jgi:TPP-dependent 2-oxoacid decarboxylase
MEAKKLPLFHGSYSPTQAHEMLSKLIKHELQFHKFQNFTSLIRYEGNCEQATQNIHNLCRAEEEIDRIISKAKAQNLFVHLEASIRLALVEEPVVEREQVACPSL